MYCNDKCCELQLSLVKKVRGKTDVLNNNDSIKSSGVIVIYKGSILLTQSYNNYWGIPKGKVKVDETLLNCALREVKEESTLDLKSYHMILNKPVYKFIPTYKNNIIYLFLCIIPSENDIVNGHVDDLHNDSTGFCWIKRSCLTKLIKSKKIKINLLTKYILNQLKKNEVF